MAQTNEVHCTYCLTNSKYKTNSKRIDFPAIWRRHPVYPLHIVKTAKFSEFTSRGFFLLCIFHLLFVNKGKFSIWYNKGIIWRQRRDNNGTSLPSVSSEITRRSNRGKCLIDTVARVFVNVPSTRKWVTFRIQSKVSIINTGNSLTSPPVTPYL